jgi:hypothetical protein
MPTETLKANMDTPFLPGLRFAIVITMSTPYKPGQGLMALFSVWIGILALISDACIARDLLVFNGAIFSSRREYYIKCQPILIGRGITVTPYTSDKW